MRSIITILLCCVLIACGQPDNASQPSPTAGTINDPTFSVFLKRTMCFGTCPDYEVTVDAQGVVTFDGRHYVEQTGIHTTTLSPEAFAELVALVDATKIAEMQDQYVVAATDLPSTTVTVTRNGVTKSVLHYGIGCLDGPSADMSGGAPAALCRLQTEIDAITNTDQWIK